MSDLTPYILYLLFAAGAAAVYFRMPRAGESKLAVGAIFGIASLIGLLALLHTQIAAPVDSRWYFYLFSVIAIAAAARVVTHPRPIWSALYFILVVIAVAALLVLFGAEFVAVALVIIYAGAILVTYLFVIMLAQQPGSPVHDRRAREPFVAVVAGFLITGVIAGKIAESPLVHPSPVALASNAAAPNTTDPDHPDNPDNPESDNTLAIGNLVMTKYVVALEIAGALLLISMIGAIALSRKKIPSEGLATSAVPLGQIGKEVDPY